MEKGFFITFEGLDGCGKTTQAKLLYDYLLSKGFSVLLTREPGGTPFAESIRQLILEPSDEEPNPLTEMLLYAAARAQHVGRLIKPELAKGKIVLCERFVDSSIAYQGYGLARNLELIKKINEVATDNLEPDLTFFFDIAADNCLQRLIKRNLDTNTTLDRIEARGDEFRHKVRQGFLKLAEEEPRIVLVNTTGKEIEAIHQEVIMLLKKYIF